MTKACGVDNLSSSVGQPQPWHTEEDNSPGWPDLLWFPSSRPRAKSSAAVRTVCRASLENRTPLGSGEWSTDPDFGGVVVLCLVHLSREYAKPLPKFKGAGVETQRDCPLWCSFCHSFCIPFSCLHFELLFGKSWHFILCLCFSVISHISYLPLGSGSCHISY